MGILLIILATLNIEEPMGEDPCATLIPGAIRINQSPICPITTDHPNAIIRCVLIAIFLNILHFSAIDTNGARVTLDNDALNILSFDSVKSEWEFKYEYRGTYSVRLVAASCAVAGLKISDYGYITFQRARSVPVLLSQLYRHVPAPLFLPREPVLLAQHYSRQRFKKTFNYVCSSTSRDMKPWFGVQRIGNDKVLSYCSLER